MEENDALPTVTDEDRAIMKAAKPDFIGFNYYNTATVEASDGSEVAGANGDQQSNQTFPGFAKSVDNPNLVKTEFVGKLTLLVSVQPSVKCTAAIVCRF